MLIDLEFHSGRPGAYIASRFVTEFDVTAGSLVLSAQVGRHQIERTCYARRLARGIYRSHLMRDALSFTVWEEHSDFEEQQAEFDAILSLADGPDREARRTRLLHRHSEYGYADTLADVLRYGRQFVRSPIPHVLAVTFPDVIGEKWHKNGPYIRSRGRVCPSPGCVNFHFYRLRLRPLASAG